jgi:hypothetical protein
VTAVTGRHGNRFYIFPKTCAAQQRSPAQQQSKERTMKPKRLDDHRTWDPGLIAGATAATLVMLMTASILALSVVVATGLVLSA